MREIVTAANEATKTQEERDAGTPFKVDGEVFHAHKPNEAQLAVFLASTGRHSSNNEQIAGVINFFASILNQGDYYKIETRLLDREDPFGLEHVEMILEDLVEEWTGNPIRLPSVSTGSPQSTGGSSTPPTPALT